MNAAVCKTSVPHTIHLFPRKETWVSAHLIAMPKNKSLSLSDFMRGPGSAVRDFSEVQEDDDTEYVKKYGIGIDCHSKFIEVCVRYRNGRTIKKAQGHFSRRMVPHDNPTTEIVTYTVQDGYNRKFYVDDYAPDAYHELDSNVCFPVYIKAYNRKNGDPSYTLNIQKRDLGRGERF